MQPIINASVVCYVLYMTVHNPITIVLCLNNVRFELILSAILALSFRKFF